MHGWLQRVWYGPGSAGLYLVPLSWFYRAVVAIRRHLFRWGFLSVIRVPCPVIVVGNVTVGGTGKTPLVLWLADQLSERGIRVGIASRGYGGRLGGGLRMVEPTDTAALVGDEPLLMRRRGQALVVVCRERSKAASRLVEEGADVVICDDGLQHLGLHRDMEIAVIDGRRRLGNGRMLPAGPLREPAARLGSVDWIVCHGGTPSPGEIRMQLVGEQLCSLSGNLTARIGDFSGRRCHAIAAIGHPDRFFDTLRSAGIDVIPHPLPDHSDSHARLREISDEGPVLMTEKDAVKCDASVHDNLWYLPVEAELDSSAEALVEAAVRLIAERGRGKEA
ncbi:MAG: tetraacyldisaccharide 4'-kinase [Gammaproteobacteria bacterium]|nr:MAG: tetraacyldisaccharide 4'-kinase [Gammaproteobacteria bacterium]